MPQKHFRYIGKGVYSLAEAARLTKITRHRISRWTRGYTFISNEKLRYSPPVIGIDLKEVPGEPPPLSFLDLLEVRFLEAFLKHGIKWKTIRIASQKAADLLNRLHPFSTYKFKTDGRTILMETMREDEDRVLLDLVKDQYVFEQIIGPFLYQGIEYNDRDEPYRWWPLGEHRSVVIDPRRAFGAPIVVPSGVPTKILAGGFKAEGSLSFVARWYDVTPEEVKDAVDFEEQLAA
jgi:uncharacterized protein (DUF433 family)